MKKSDSHVHTQYCPHGTKHKMEQYVKVAIEKGLEAITFTEHAPLPIDDPVPSKDSAMREEDVYAYLKEVKGLKAQYGHKIEINAGFEVDYIEGKEKETQLFLEQYPETIPYSILSVHFLKLPDASYYCIDYSKESFVEKGSELGYEMLYTLYEKTVKLALSEPFGTLTPKKIGHINLIHKFKKGYGYTDEINWKQLLTLAKKNQYKLDYNFAGMDKPDYGEPYPNKTILSGAKKLDLILETGSDAHEPKDVGRYFIEGEID
ncbi:histidinol-phosphatase HisJ [Marinilactibacillus kalidii]|uniref:histidinol-phosphatase HisJ n=1 Tax=Marinilactibacillus kalidii TaxID=2820274 RepID=UPI001ABE10B1|nr:histidinol-phosphatase HisJ [Marinilactibacillus kalidii]